jgi:hypothetical protein
VTNCVSHEVRRTTTSTFIFLPDEMWPVTGVRSDWSYGGDRILYRPEGVKVVITETDGNRQDRDVWVTSRRVLKSGQLGADKQKDHCHLGKLPDWIQRCVDEAENWPASAD